jgi:tetratricopeptide (TPR) repeat protein
VTQDVFRTADAARVLGVSPHRVRAMVRAGWCRPSRAGRAYAFHFQDLVLLRTAHGLAQARVPARRVKRALAELLRQLPHDRPLSGIRISAQGGRVVVRDRDTVWQPESGQFLLDFSVDELARRTAAPPAVSRSAPPATAAAASAADWFDYAVDAEDRDVEEARNAYQRALELDPDLGDAYVNLGRLAHEAGDAATAVRCYHQALARDEVDPVTHYNLALALEDLERNDDAVCHYQRAVALNPSFADAHYNLSQLLARIGRKDDAVRHMVRYRQLVRHR